MLGVGVGGRGEGAFSCVYRNELSLDLKQSSDSAVTTSRAGCSSLVWSWGRMTFVYTVSLVFLLPILRLRGRKPRVLLALLVAELMWDTHLRSSRIVTPRYFVMLTFSMMYPWSSYAGMIFFRLRVALGVEHFCRWKSMDHCSSQVVTESGSPCSVRWSSAFLMVLLHMVSSANSLTLDLIPAGRSLM